MRLTSKTLLPAAGMACFMAAAWFFLAPPVIGGATTYTITTGNSMEPLLHDGDLAVVRERPSYAVGDVVAYESDELGRTVLHRIIGSEGDGFTFKGDNNDFLDPEQPGSDQIIGTMWFHVPKLGDAFTALRSPIGLGIGALVVIVLSSGTVASTRRRRARARHSSRRDGRVQSPVRLATVPTGEEPPTESLRRVPPPPPPPRVRPDDGRNASRWAMSHRAQRARLAAFVSLAVAIAFGGAAFYMRTQPATLAGASDARYLHSGSFAYRAAVTDSAAYDGPELQTGEPVFLKVVDEITVTYDYAFGSEADHDVESDGTLEARLTAGNGLKRTIPLNATASGAGDELSLSAPLALDRIRDLVRRVEKETGVDQSSYMVTVVADVSVAGTLAERPLDESFDSSMELRFDGLQLSAPLTADGTIAKDTFVDSATGTIEGQEVFQNEVAIAGRRVSVGTIERAGWNGAGAALLALMVALLFLRFFSPRDEANRIHAKYGTLIVPIKEGPPAGPDTVEVPDIDTLVRLAEQFEQVILHEAAGDRHTYTVSYDGLLYRYGVKTSQTRPRSATA